MYKTGRIAQFAKIYGKRINLQELIDYVSNRWNINIVCKEMDNKIYVTYEEAAESKINEIKKELVIFTRLSKTSFIYQSVTVLLRNYSGKYMKADVK